MRPQQSRSGNRLIEEKNHDQGFAAAVAVVSLVIAVAAVGLTQSDKVKGFEVPRFEVDPDWPNLPNGWKLGITSSIAVDRHDHVWVLQRPRLLSGRVKTGH